MLGNLMLKQKVKCHSLKSFIQMDDPNAQRYLVSLLRFSVSRISLFALGKALVLLALFLVLTVPSGACALGPSDSPPAFSLSSLSNKMVSSADYRGKVLYIDFWASWCGPCRHTLPWMQQLQQKFKARGLEVFAINVDTKRANADKLLEGLNPSFTVLFDPNGEVAKKYQLPSMPTSFLVGKDGKIVRVQSGFREGDAEELEAQIEKLLTIKE